MSKAEGDRLVKSWDLDILLNKFRCDNCQTEKKQVTCMKRRERVELKLGECAKPGETGLDVRGNEPKRRERESVETWGWC